MTLMRGGRSAAADPRVMTREQAQQLIQKVVKFSRADSILVNVGGGYSANVRFADNRISTAGGIAAATLNIQSSFGPKHAVISTNDFTDAALENAIAPYRGRDGLAWSQSEPSLEDVFIDLMGKARDNFQ